MRPGIAATLSAVSVLAVGYGAARAIDHALTVRWEVKASLADDARPLPDSLRRPLPLRLVDAGGTGIRPDTARWKGVGGARDYSHATGAFLHVLLAAPPYVDDTAFAALQRDWISYLARVGAYGSNGVVVPGVFQYVNFERVGDGFAVYRRGDPARARQATWRRRFAGLFEVARQRGLRVYLASDMLVLTPALEHYLKHEPGGLNVERPELWETYAAGLAELFDSLPAVDGIVIRVGEGGALFNPAGWEYQSRVAVRTSRALHTMLHALLPVFERYGRTLVLRTWSVGAGALGDLHTNPATYGAVLNDVDSPNLIISTKYVRGDFYSYEPVNPTLLVGRQRRIIEFQARREYEGFGAFPNYVAPLHRAALAQLLTANPHIVGSWLWTQDGGPLRAGPMSLYPHHGFWAWIDANVYATARLTLDPGADPRALTSEWARHLLGTDTAAVQAVTQVLLKSREAVERGLYIRPFADRAVQVFGVEVPPMLWILEWNVVGGSSAVWSAVYRASHDQLDAAIADGFAAARLARAMRDTLERIATSRHNLLLTQMAHSLEYEESLLETLAWYRRAMLEHYRWLDTGDPEARAAWEESSPRFVALAHDHTGRFGGDIEAPAYDFAAARAGLAAAALGPSLAWAARLLLAVIGLLLVRPRWARWWLLAACATAAVAILSGASSLRLVVASTLVCATAASVQRAVWADPTSTGRKSTAWLVRRGILGGLAGPVGLAAVRGPWRFWFLVWSSSGTRIGLITTVVAVVGLTFLGVTRSAPRAAAGLLVAAGAAGLVTSLLAPDLASMLAGLERPLGLMPMGASFIHGALAYFALPQAAPWYPAVAGGALGVAGLAWRRVAIRRSFTNS